MARRTVITNESIVGAAVEMVRCGQIKELNARSLARSIGCSTQPIFRAFANMQELWKEVYAKCFEIYSGYMAKGENAEGNKYKNIGLAYLSFAKSEPEIYKIIFLSERTSGEFDKKNEENLSVAVKFIMDKLGVSEEVAKNLHLLMWLFIQGVASTMVSGFSQFTDDELSELLSMEFKALSEGVRGLK